MKVLVEIKLKPVIAGAIVLFLGSSVAFGSEICRGTSVDSKSSYGLKKDFLNGDFDRFFEALDSIELGVTETQVAIEQLNESFPNGFDQCAYLVSEQVSEHLATEILLFEDEHSNLVYLYISTVKSSSG